MIHGYSYRYLREVLDRTRTIAAVGVSLNEVRPSFFVARYLALQGFKVLPVNPVYAGKNAFGQKVHKSLSSLPRKHDPIDMVDIFRRSEEAGRVVDEALDKLLHRGLKTIWMQIGVIDKKAAKRAEAKGVEVLMDVCPKMEYQRLWGELSRGGINSGVVTSKLGYVSLQLPDTSGSK
ncbi:MAG: CoA-binding protein [Pseudomonadota bacterium]